MLHTFDFENDFNRADILKRNILIIYKQVVPHFLPKCVNPCGTGCLY